MRVEIDELKDAQITVKIPSSLKDEMRALVKKGMFNSLSECTRTSINRLLREIDDYVGEVKEADMKKLERFVEELGELYK